jgi:hypothetical protein
MTYIPEIQRVSVELHEKFPDKNFYIIVGENVDVIKI